MFSTESTSLPVEVVATKRKEFMGGIRNFCACGGGTKGPLLRGVWGTLRAQRSVWGVLPRKILKFKSSNRSNFKLLSPQNSLK